MLAGAGEGYGVALRLTYNKMAGDFDPKINEAANA